MSEFFMQKVCVNCAGEHTFGARDVEAIEINALFDSLKIESQWTMCTVPQRNHISIAR